jgi:hypothetical protein
MVSADGRFTSSKNLSKSSLKKRLTKITEKFSLLRPELSIIIRLLIEIIVRLRFIKMQVQLLLNMV